MIQSEKERTVKKSEYKMKEKTLVFIPYQDTDTFFSDSILTREYAMLYMLWSSGYNRVINIKKPRTFLDKKRYCINETFYPAGSVEAKVKDILNEAQTVQYLPLVSFRQILQRRGWWKAGYAKTAAMLPSMGEDCLVYSNNPFAAPLLRELREMGCKIYFDIMDNFAIHPSLNEKERKQALEGYKEVLSFADLISANSVQSCNYMAQLTERKIHLVKNGVFVEHTTNQAKSLMQLEQIQEKARNYRNCAAYVGKLGLRLDADLIETVSRACPETLFVFIGSYLKGQINEKLISLFREDNNVIHISAIPSAYVCSVCRQFDMLIIPHSLGRFENGGDPLKLYQYLSTRKPIISTPILGVDEYQDYICIEDNPQAWIRFLQQDYEHFKEYDIPDSIDWWRRAAPILETL